MRRMKKFALIVAVTIFSTLPAIPAFAATGWKQENGKWYYHEGNTAKTGWVWDNEVKYYLGSEGVMKTGWQKVDGSWYYFRGDGAMHTGWWNDDGVWYYLTLDGSMAHDCYGPDGHWMESSGSWNADKVAEATEGTGYAAQLGYKTMVDYLNTFGITGNKEIDRTKYITFLINWDTDTTAAMVGGYTRDMAITSALLGRTSTDALVSEEKEVYEVAKAFLDTNIKKSDSDELKVKKIVNYLYTTITYNLDGTSGSYGALVNKSTYCAGYARTFKVLANASGLECYYVGGTNINGRGHAWNVVRVDGKWANVDASANMAILTDAEFSRVNSTRDLYYRENVPACN